MKTSIGTLLAAQLLLVACGGTSAPATPSEPAPAAAPSNELPPGHPPVNADPHAGTPHAQGQPLQHDGTTQVAPAPTGPASAGGLQWTHSEPLVRRTPKSSMRAAEYGLASDASAELSVFYFGPDQGGSVDANVTRWLGQLTQPDGSDGASKAKRSTREVNGVQVTLVETTGRYAGGMMPGAPSSVIEDAMLLGAIASGPQGPVFFKLVGPRASVEQARGAFDALIGSLKP